MVRWPPDVDPVLSDFARSVPRRQPHRYPLGYWTYGVELGSAATTDSRPNADDDKPIYEPIYLAEDFLAYAYVTAVSAMSGSSLVKANAALYRLNHLKDNAKPRLELVTNSKGTQTNITAAGVIQILLPRPVSIPKGRYYLAVNLNVGGAGAPTVPVSAGTKLSSISPASRLAVNAESSVSSWTPVVHWESTVSATSPFSLCAGIVSLKGAQVYA